MASSDNNTQRRRRKVLIRKEDIASVLTRYSEPTKLSLLEEVAQYPDVKIDWNVLVKKTTTGITNGAEYQKLWRHLAYCDKLPETVEEKPKEQHLEYELEAFPPATDEASLEAAACVKVLLASGLQDDAGGGSATVEAPLTINIPTWQDYKSPLDNPLLCSLKGINITVPVSVQKQLWTAVRTAEEGLDATVSNAGGQAGIGKKKHWTAEEDNELIAAVKKFGKRNWADIVKADIFKGDRTASQLSQRWGIIRKRLKLEAGGGELIARQRATNRAVSSALNMPIINSLLAAYAASVVPNPMVQEAAVAAGARIATHLTAKSLRKAARSKKSPMPGVHYICTGLSSASPATYSTSVPSVSPPPPTPAEKSQVPSASVEAPSTINRPTCQDSKSPLDNNPQPCSLNGMDTIVPVSVQKQSSPPAVTIAKGLDGTVSNAVVGRPAKRKRNKSPWTTEEDNELFAAVKKFGERNWVNILKADILKGDRSAAQLSHRWGIIRNRQNELPDQWLATNRAVTRALNTPMNNSLSAACTVGPANLVASAATVSSPQIPLQTTKGTSGVMAKRRSITKKTAPVVPNPMIQTAAISAGSRIATPPTAIPLLKSCTIQTAVHNKHQLCDTTVNP
ncbi:uncharacterized protein LOC113274589 [Papaver somniferum]|nr:uncharacterized protein LOC113274589 [Papaver somniferum]XP_026379760.1 uncharacterized protein LOC113274589 [Papaver somniferum]